MRKMDEVRKENEEVGRQAGRERGGQAGRGRERKEWEMVSEESGWGGRVRKGSE